MGKVNKNHKHRMLRMIRRHTGMTNSSAVAIAKVLRARFPERRNSSKSDLFQWVLQNTAATARAQRHIFRAPHQSDAFLVSYEWRRLRMAVIVERGARCECCGATPDDGKTVIHVDHIKPRKEFPELALEKSNLQVLCHVCNHGKGNWDQSDWRKESRAGDMTAEQACAILERAFKDEP